MDADEPDQRVEREFPPEPPRPSQPSPEHEALQQMLSETLSREMLLRVEIIRMRRQTAA